MEGEIEQKKIIKKRENKKRDVEVVVVLVVELFFLFGFFVRGQRKSVLNFFKEFREEWYCVFVGIFIGFFLELEIFVVVVYFFFLKNNRE